MPTAVTWNGTAYSVPNSGELNWATLTNFLVDLGNNAQTTNFQTLGARIATSTPVTVSATTDCIVNINIASAATVNLPAGATGQVFYINDISGAAATNPITLDGDGAETINGSATLALSRNDGGVCIAWNGTEWRVISESYGGTAFNVDKAATFSSTLTSVGVADASSAAAGEVGEVIETNVTSGSAVTLTGTTQWTDIANIALTAGDWEITTSIAFGANPTPTDWGMLVGTASGNNTTGATRPLSLLSLGFAGITFAAGTNPQENLPVYRVNISGSQTYYLKANMAWSSGNTPSAFGNIRARRIR